MSSTQGKWLTIIVLAAILLLGSLAAINSCKGLALQDIHVGYMGAGVDLRFDHSEEAEFHLHLPMERQSYPLYQNVANNTRIRLNMTDSTHFYRLVPEHYELLVDTVHRNVYISWGYVLDQVETK